MQVTETDLRRAEQLLATLKRAKFELQGEEVLAVAQVISWAAGLGERLREPAVAATPQPRTKK